MARANRRRRDDFRSPDTGVLSVRPITPAGVSSDAIAGVNGWQPFGSGQHPSDQRGAYTGVPLNQFPVQLPGVQRHCGVEFMDSSWFTPTRFAVPTGGDADVQATVQGASARRIAAAGARVGSTFGGPQGPTNTNRFKSRQVAGAAQASAIKAEPWAQINPYSTEES